MTEAEADAVFARHDEIAHVALGAHLVTRETVRAHVRREGGQIDLEAGTHMRVTSHIGTALVDAEAVIDEAVVSIGIFGDEFHKLAIVRVPEAKSAPEPAESQVPVIDDESERPLLTRSTISGNSFSRLKVNGRPIEPGDTPRVFGKGNIVWPEWWSDRQRAEWRRANNVPGREWSGEQADETAPALPPGR